MASKATVFFERLRGKKIAVIGVGVSHTDLIRMLAAKSLDVIVYDKRTPEQLGDLYQEFKGLGVSMELGPNYLSRLGGEDIIFRTPGMNYHTPELSMARKAGTVVTSELEVFFDLCPCKIIGVTGSDGKTTTTTLIARMLETAGHTVHLGGNIGRALLPGIEKVKATDYVVAELSSFQLISMRQSPDVAVITNITPNHLDVHKTMEEYVEAKSNIFSHQNGFSTTILNADNSYTKKFAKQVRGKLNLFSRQSAVQRGAWMDENGMIWYSSNDSQTKVIDSKEILLPGAHNIENFLAAFSAVWELVPREAMLQVARTFTGVEHRIELVRTLDGVRWYNDSIATSPTRTIAGFHSFDQRLILIAGGYDKQIPFEPLIPELLDHVKTLILMGSTAQKIEDTLRADPRYTEGCIQLLHAQSLSDAVTQARAAANQGDVVTLSPACASFDSYPNFEARGTHFKELVNSLA